MSFPKPTETDFAAWHVDNLVKFARESNERMRIMQEMMDELRADCRLALQAYRDLVKKGSENI